MHATAGILGGILTGFFASSSVYGPFAAPDVPYHAGVFYDLGNANGDQGKQLGVQMYGVVVTILYASVVSLLLLKLVDITLGLEERFDANDALPSGAAIKENESVEAVLPFSTEKAGGEHALKLNNEQILKEPDV